jgi:anti-sigma factor RsiW
VSCKRARRELLDYFAFGEELGSRSDPYLAHMQSCAECREEVGIDRALVKSLRRALRERVEGRAPSQSSWELVRRRTVDSPTRPWSARVVQWGGMVSGAAVAGVMLFAVATAPESRLFPDTQSPFIASAARRAVPPVDENRGLSDAESSTFDARQTDPQFPGWARVKRQVSDPAPNPDGDPPITGHMR